MIRRDKPEFQNQPDTFKPVGSVVQVLVARAQAYQDEQKRQERERLDQLLDGFY